jgi:glycosyltransferase involved in cell wall biosynthesis
MHVLFVHRAFPAQFGRLALELTRRYDWQCSFVVEHLSHCPPPSPEMLDRLAIWKWAAPPRPTAEKGRPWPQAYGEALERGRSVFEVVRANAELRPDLVVGHGGLVPTLFLRDVLSCPIIDYCEYYFAPRRRDLTYRLDLPPVEPAPFYPRCINAATIVNLVAADAAYTPTEWQRDSFPRQFHARIEVHPDGVDTELYRPAPEKPWTPPDIPSDAPVVTFVSRGLESMRGFDRFMKLAARLGRERADVHFVVVGEENTHYGWDRLHTGGQTFKQWTMNTFDGDHSRVHFLGRIEPEQLAAVLARSSLHVYLSVPFVVSWSLLNAMSCGCVVLAGDTLPVREILTHGENGLVEPLFDVDRQVDMALRVLAAPREFRPLGEAARRRVEVRHGMDRTVAELKQFFERVAGSSK